VNDGNGENVVARARTLLARSAVVRVRPPAACAEDAAATPWDLAALYAVCDGLELADGTRILGRDEAARATAWLKDEKSLDWDAALTVIGERDDLVIVHDVDRVGARAGGGILEAPTDGLSSFRRVALGVIGYLEERAGEGSDPEPAPERAAREAIARGDTAALAAAIARGFYPSAGRELAHAALSLGVLHARAGDTARAMEAFARAVEARASAVPRGAEAAEAAAAWRAAAITAEGEGAVALAAVCRERAAAAR
jgi:hypothetical protein